MVPSDARARLLRHGLLLFLIGLLTGFAIPAMANPRVGVSAHLEGVLNGTFLVVIGLAWSELRLSDRAARWAFGLVVYGAWANWTATTAAGLLGTHTGLEIAGAGHHGTAWQEKLVFAGLVSVGLSMVLALALLVRGAFRRAGADG